jgi:hypothetical protein
LFKHEDLFDLERETGLPIRLAFIAMFTVADREGRFKWRPRTLKVECLPHDDCDFSRVLDALSTRGFVVKYACGGETYGYIPSFNRHQVVNNREHHSELPEPNENNILTRASRVNDACSTALEQDQGEGKGREQEGEREGDTDANASVVNAEPLTVDLKIERDRKRLIEERAKLHLLGCDWNSMAKDLGLAQIEEIIPGSPREKSALARIREGRDFARAFTNIRASPFLRGDKGSTPCAFDWVINPTNFQKIIEGNYNNEIRKAQLNRPSYARQL